MKSRTIKTKKGSCTLIEPGIIRFELNKNAEWTLPDAKETHKANMELSEGGKFFVYMIAKHFFVPTEEAQKFVASKECTDHRIAGVFVIKNAGMKLLGTLFMKFFKSKSPSIIFKTEKEALTWMRSRYKEVVGA